MDWRRGGWKEYVAHVTDVDFSGVILRSLGEWGAGT